ncbi:MAG: hypothetical protein K8R12_02080 [Desulfobacterales bacterium]|nr:hypothetical protein [Desulfobacterales bacterium]MCD4787150.1 hypothetical protein [Desulfobacterales bacterium]
MDIRFLPHNIHLEDPCLFSSRDPHLQHLQKQSLIHRSGLLDLLPRYNLGIYTISGGWQIGKTTSKKLQCRCKSGTRPDMAFSHRNPQ